MKKTLEGIEGVTGAEVSHEKGTAVVTLEKEIADSVLKEAVEAQDYKGGICRVIAGKVGMYGRLPVLQEAIGNVRCMHGGASLSCG